jgi:hypothetical protein
MASRASNGFAERAKPKGRHQAAGALTASIKGNGQMLNPCNLGGALLGVSWNKNANKWQATMTVKYVPSPFAAPSDSEHLTDDSLPCLPRFGRYKKIHL